MCHSWTICSKPTNHKQPELNHLLKRVVPFSPLVVLFLFLPRSLVVQACPPSPFYVSDAHWLKQQDKVDRTKWWITYWKELLISQFQLHSPAFFWIITVTHVPLMSPKQIFYLTSRCQDNDCSFFIYIRCQCANGLYIKLSFIQWTVWTCSVRQSVIDF